MNNMNQTNNMNQMIELNSGMKIPQLGFGCFQIDDSEIEKVIKYAAKAGYRYFDTATRYENEESVGGLSG